MPRTRIVGLNEEQLIHALSIDDAYHVERTLVESRGKGVTERVTMEGSGPFVRKKIPLELANRAVWAVLQECDSLRLPRVALTYELPIALLRCMISCREIRSKALWLLAVGCQ